MNKKKRTCHDCWQYSEHCDKCDKGICYWFISHPKPSLANDCEAFNDRYREQRKHRDENEELMPLLEGFYDFLQKKFVPEGYRLSSLPKLTQKQAFTVIYVMQEYLHVIPDSFEACDGCGELFDSYSEGYYLDDEYKLNGKKLPKKFWGHWCDNCVPEVDFEF